MIILRAFLVWLMIIAVETVHGIFRGLLLVPWLGDLRSRQIGVFIGSLIIFLVAYVFINWIDARSTAFLLAIGLLWALLTLAFELVLGIYLLGLSQERIWSDYDIVNGGLMPLGLLFLLFTPVLAFKAKKRIA